MVCRVFTILVAACLVAIAFGGGALRRQHPGLIIPDAAAASAAALVASATPSMLLVEDSYLATPGTTVDGGDDNSDEDGDGFNSIYSNEADPLAIATETSAESNNLVVTTIRADNSTDAPAYIFDAISRTRPAVNFTCYNCRGIGTLGENCLRGLRGLQVVRLESADIRKLQKGAFEANAGTLSQLWLGGNSFISFRQGKLPALVVLSLRGNKRLGSIRINAVNLRMIDLSGMSPAVVHGLRQMKAPQLQVILMANSDLTPQALPFDVLQNFTFIQSLQLSDNTQLGMPRNRPFLSSQSLTSLVCARCGITSIGSRTLQLLPALEVLDVRENTDLSYISMTAFRMLSSLRELRLEGCTGLLVPYPTVNALVTTTFWPQTLQTLCVPVPIVTRGLVPERRNLEKAPEPPLLASDANVTGITMHQWGIYILADRTFRKTKLTWAVSLPEMSYTRASMGRRVMIRALRDQVGYPCPGGHANRWALDRVIKAFDKYPSSAPRSNMTVLRMARSNRTPDGEEGGANYDLKVSRSLASLVSTEDGVLGEDTHRETNYRTASRDYTDDGYARAVSGVADNNDGSVDDIGNHLGGISSHDEINVAEIYVNEQTEPTTLLETTVLDDLTIEPVRCEEECVYQLRATLGVTIGLIGLTIGIVFWFCMSFKTEPTPQPRQPTSYIYSRGHIIDNIKDAADIVRGKA